jgi:hypothetical protein
LTETDSSYVNNVDGGVETSKLNVSDGQIKDTETDIYDKFIQYNAGTFDWRRYPDTDENSAISPKNDWTWGNPVDVTASDPCRKVLKENWRVRLLSSLCFRIIRFI